MEIDALGRICFGAVLFFILYQVVTTFYVLLICLLVTWLAIKYVESKNRRFHSASSKSVLITGCDSGFGHHLALKLAEKGFIVFAGVLHANGKGADTLRDKKCSNLQVLKLDVTKTTDIQDALRLVENYGAGLWGVVNNAGFDIPGDLELVTLEQYKKVVDTNLWGQVSVIKAFLPLIRKAKGRIVNVSSVRGRYAWPSGSSYHISKYGIETMSDCLRLEMQKFGVGVSIVEPGWYDNATSITSPEMCDRVKKECDVMLAEASDDVKACYGEKYFYRGYQSYKLSSSSASASSPKPVLDAIEDALLNHKPKPRYLLFGGKRYYDPFAMFALLYNLTPQFLSDYVISRFTGSHRQVHEQSQ